MNNKPWYVIVGIFLATVALLVTVMGFFYQVRAVLPPFIIALVITLLFNPLLDSLQRRGCPRILAVTVVFAVFMATFVLAIWFLVPAISAQAVQLGIDYPLYADSFKSTMNDIIEKHQSLLVRFHLPTTLKEIVAQSVNLANERMKTAIPQVGNWIATNAAKVLWLILIPLISFYMLNDIHRIRKKAFLLIPARYRPESEKLLTRVGTVFSNYVRGLIVVCLLNGFVITIVLLMFRLKYGIILGMLAGVLYAVPYLGSITTIVLVFLVGLATYPHGLTQAVTTTLVVWGSNQLLFDLVITPRILGKSVGLHPVLSLFALLAGGQLFGLPGMILSVPIAASIQEIVAEFLPELKAYIPPDEPQHLAFVGKLRKKVTKKPLKE